MRYDITIVSWNHTCTWENYVPRSFTAGMSHSNCLPMSSLNNPPRWHWKWKHHPFLRVRASSSEVIGPDPSTIKQTPIHPSETGHRQLSICPLIILRHRSGLLCSYHTLHTSWCCLVCEISTTTEGNYVYFHLCEWVLHTTDDDGLVGNIHSRKQNSNCMDCHP